MQRLRIDHGTHPSRLLVGLVFIGLAIASIGLGAIEAAAQDITQSPTDRIQWTTSRVLGSPEPPLPYTTELVFGQIEWDRPIYAKAEPGTDWLVVVQQGGEDDRPTKILRVRDSPDVAETTTLIEIPGRLVYGLAFHPDYIRNGQLFIFSNGPTAKPKRHNRILRYTVRRDAQNSCDLDSEAVILEWQSQGHDGGELAFGADGMLYISSGDGTSDSDKWLSGQDISNLLGGVLRIDVDHPTKHEPYAIPEDNPFVGIPNARGELWAFGLRNPWRLWADRQTGQIWVGNNGQDLWETVHLIRRGENYGWSVYEGSHHFYAHRQRGPAPIAAPTIEHHHTESRSLTGGVVYRGTCLPELDGAYIYGDYSTGKIWAARHDGDELTWHQEIADTTHQIAGFAITPTEDLVVIDHGGGLHRIIKAPPQKQQHPFPQRLSETGLFVSVAEHQLHPGVIPYSVNAQGWHDQANATRFLALPGDGTIKYTPNRGWNFPEGTVLVQTLSYNSDELQRRIETRLLTKQQGEWVGYAYRWNATQDEGFLVPSAGEQVELSWPIEGSAMRTWNIPSRAECMSCHSRAVNFVLGLSHVQMNREMADGRNQLQHLGSVGLFDDPMPELKDTGIRLVDPYDETQSLDSRARSYLHTNCASCHVEAGGGNARMELEATKEIDDMRIVSVRPQHTTFGIRNAMLLAPGDPERSVLYHRIARRGAGQMPPLVTALLDRRAVNLMHQWISSLERPPQKFVRDWQVDDLVPHLGSLNSGRSLHRGEEIFRDLACDQCHRFADQGGGAGPTLTSAMMRQSPAELLESIIQPSAKITPGFETTVVVTEDGITRQGRLASETQDGLTIQPNEAFGNLITIPKREIEQRFLAKKSLMPDGVVNSLERDEILDLLAYLLNQEESTQHDDHGD